MLIVHRSAVPISDWELLHYKHTHTHSLNVTGSSLFFFLLLKNNSQKYFLKANKNKRWTSQINTHTDKYIHIYIPGFSYISSNNNLSNSRRRSFEHLRRVREEDEILISADTGRPDQRQTKRETEVC